jgi:hypothetical protein
MKNRIRNFWIILRGSVLNLFRKKTVITLDYHIPETLIGMSEEEAKRVSESWADLDDPDYWKNAIRKAFEEIQIEGTESIFEKSKSLDDFNLEVDSTILSNIVEAMGGELSKEEARKMLEQSGAKIKVNFDYGSGSEEIDPVNGVVEWKNTGLDQPYAALADIFGIHEIESEENRAKRIEIYEDQETKFQPEVFKLFKSFSKKVKLSRGNWGENDRNPED